MRTQKFSPLFALALLAPACDSDDGRSDDGAAESGSTDASGTDSGDSSGGDTDGGSDDGSSDGGDDTSDPGAGEPLDIDCTADESDEDLRCSPAKWLDDEDSFGEGPSLAPLPGFARGYLGGSVSADAGKLYVGVRYGFDTTTSVTGGRKGVIMAIDLVTGDRELVAGELLYDEDDPRNTERGEQRGLNGAPAEMGYVMDVRLGTDGMLYALASPTSQDGSHIWRVDPATGDGQELWSSEDDVANCPFSPEDDRSIRPSAWSMAMADDGGFYLSFSNNPAGAGLGIMKVAADGSACEMVMRSTGTDVLPNVGTFLENPECNEDGPWCPDAGPFRALEVHDGRIWGTLTSSGAIYTIDPATGDHERLLGTNNPPAGDGASGVKWIDFDHEEDVLWTIGGHTGGSMPIMVYRDIGVAEPREADGALRFGAEGPIWRHPTRPLVIVADEASIVLCETPLESENCANFSR